MITIAGVTADLGLRRSWGIGDLVLYLIGVAGLAAALTVLWLGMRAVMDVGGYCAEGGPYVIDVHCPDGVALLIPLSIFLGLGSAALAGIKGAALGGGWGAIVLLAWPALFISLGWNFLEYAFNPPGDETGIVWGWLIPGVLFVLMGAFPLLAFVPDRDGRSRRQRPAAKYDAAAEGEARYANELKRQRRRLLNDLVHRANRQATAATSGSSVPAPALTAAPSAQPGAAAVAGDSDDADDDLVSRLERLAALYRSGSLSYDEYQRAKSAVIGGAK